jgi:O-antigen ligase
VTAAYFLVSVYRGTIHNIYGRYLYFGNLQPNLGGEIMAAGVFTAGLFFRPTKFLIYSTFLLVPIFLLQARAALLFVIFLQVVCLYFAYFRRASPAGRLTWLLVAMILLAVSSHRLWKVIDAAFLIDDRYRGFGTGFSGRFSQWSEAWNAFIKHPFLGNGFGYLESIGSPGAHNFFLFLLSENGLLGLIIVGWIFYGIFRFGRSDVRTMMWFSSFLILAMFNDRFVNLNPYPFLFYVFMWIPGQFVSVRCVRILSGTGKPPIRSTQSKNLEARMARHFRARGASQKLFVERR